MTDVPDAVLQAIAQCPTAAGVFFGLLLIARVFDRRLPELRDVMAEAAAGLRSIATAVRGDRRPKTEPGDDRKRRTGAQLRDDDRERD